MKNRFTAHLLNLIAIFSMLILPAMAPAQQLTTPLVFTQPPLPRVCELVFHSRTKAQRSCPPGAPVIEWYDFWQRTRLGWVCDCSHIAP